MRCGKRAVDTPRIAASLVDIYNVMILRRGMFHADPHPGNLFVLPAGGRHPGAHRARRLRG